ncbi:hypothetical protein C2W62_23310 [Candidatus Entotheonella serta]|nr:hypothetical protein C2W62_23310 [Candidatus Entotheonella serta]
MSIETNVAQVIDLLQRQGWASYRTLRRRFHFDEAMIEAIKTELIEVRQVAVENESGQQLVWRGELRPAMASPGIFDAVLEATPAAVADVAPVSVSPLEPLPASIESSRPLTSLVGREQEVGLLRQRWSQAQSGQGQVVVVRGEAGIGKSRLVQVLKSHVAGEPHLRWECRCASEAQNSALYPIIDLFQRGFHFELGDDPSDQLRKMESALSPYEVSLPELMPLFASLLSVPLANRHPPLTISPIQQRQRTLAAVRDLLLSLAAEQPVLLIVEDLHWVDPSTLELLSLLIEPVASSRLYMVLTSRPEFQAPWASPAHSTTLTLTRLLPVQVNALVKEVAGSKNLPTSVLDRIVTEAEGVPLFVEEMTRMVLDSAVLESVGEGSEPLGSLPQVLMPKTVQELVQSRLRTLGSSAQAVAQVGAMWGRTITESQMEAISPLGWQELPRALSELVGADILQEIELPPQVTYVFKHALIQEAAYGMMSPEARQARHGQMGEVLETQFGELVERQPELVAHHYMEAGLNEQAVI